MVMQEVKRALRPLIPDTVMARYRLHQHSRHSRANVDVFLTDPRAGRRWLVATPDTYRVRLDLPEGDPGDIEVLIDGELAPSAEQERRARQTLADPWLAAAVVAEVDEPRLIRRRRAEPPMAPLLIAVRGQILEEIGGVPAGDHPLPAILNRIRDAGHPFGLIPVPLGKAAVERSDPIEAPSIVIFAAVPMHDIGGGARSTQLALEFLRRGYHVALVALYQAQESVDLGLRYIHPRLEQHQAVLFDPAAHASRTARPGTVIVEAPAEPLVSKATTLQGSGWHLIYDLIDHWSDPALGGEWFDQRLERDLVTNADRVIASAPDLVDRVWRMGREATLVPNGVNAEIFGVELPPRPDDLPEADLLIGYHGSLYGDWFDWEGLRAVADAFPKAAVVVIGDDKVARPEMPANVHFLGLKPQSELPAYLQRLDVGILPFKLNDTTHAVSPLKVYEYLASGVPVAAPPLRSLEGLEGVVVGEPVEAVDAALRRPRPDPVLLLAEHGWEARVQQIVGHRSATSEVEARVISRPVRHWVRRERRAERV